MYKKLGSIIKSSMLYFDFHKTRFIFSIGFFFIVGYLCSSGDRLSSFSLVFCFLHEIAHLLAMRAYGVKLSSIKLYGGGIKINSDGIYALPVIKQAVIYSIGCFANISLGIVYLLIDANELAIANFSLALMNLLPVSHLDGGQILKCLFPCRQSALKMLSKITIAVVASASVLVCFSANDFNEVLIIAFVFVISSIIDIV